MSCLTRGNKSLQPHQKRFVDAFIKSKQRGALAIHGAGSGKTLLAVATSKCYIDKYPSHQVIIITPASLLSGFKKELGEYDNSANTQYKYYTYAGYVKNPCKCDDALIIIDEAQNLKNTDGKTFKVVMDCAKDANKVLLLSATPIINSTYDLEPLMSIIHGTSPTDEASFNQILQHKKLSAIYFGCHLSFFKNDPVRTAKYFPTTKEIFVPIVMDQNTLTLYNNLEKDKSTKQIANIFDIDKKNEKDLQSFFNGLRRISSSSSQKINFMMKFMNQIINVKKPNAKLGITDHMIKSHTDKFIIFTHFKTHGSNLIVKELKKVGISYGFIDGSVPKTKRAKVVNQYVAGDIKVILISAAGATGLNLLETGYMFLVEPSWNESEVTQVMARADRYLSHDKLPKYMRNVLIMKLLLIKPHEARDFTRLITNKTEYKDPSIDVKMVVDSIRKQKAITDVLTFLENNIPSLESCKSSIGDLHIGKLYEMKKLDTIPRLTKSESEILTTKPSDDLAKPQTNSHKTLSSHRKTKQPTGSKIPRNVNLVNVTMEHNTELSDNIISIAGIRLLKHKTTILFNDTSYVLIYRFLSSNSNVFAHVLADRLTDGAIKKVRLLPRTRVITVVKKYKIGVFNGYIDFETNSINKISNIISYRMLKTMHDQAKVVVALISWDLFKSDTMQTWLKTKQYKVVRYVSPFYTMSHTSSKIDAEMVIIRIYS